MTQDIVKVEWVDSGMHVDYGWADLETYKKDTDSAHTSVVTVGMLMHEDDDVVLVGLSFDPSHEHWYGAQMIVKKNITSYKVIDRITNE